MYQSISVSLDVESPLVFREATRWLAGRVVVKPARATWCGPHCKELHRVPYVAGVSGRTQGEELGIPEWSGLMEGSEDCARGGIVVVAWIGGGAKSGGGEAADPEGEAKG